MRKAITAILLSLMIATSVSSCTSSPGGHEADATGALLIAAILGGAVAVAVH